MPLLIWIRSLAGSGLEFYAKEGDEMRRKMFLMMLMLLISSQKGVLAIWLKVAIFKTF